MLHIEKTAADIADMIITVSYPMEEDLIRHGFDSYKIKVSWNGICVDKYDPKRLANEDIIGLRSRYGIGPEETSCDGIIPTVETIFEYSSRDVQSNIREVERTFWTRPTI